MRKVLLNHPLSLFTKSVMKILFSFTDFLGNLSLIQSKWLKQGSKMCSFFWGNAIGCQRMWWNLNGHLRECVRPYYIYSIAFIHHKDNLTCAQHALEKTQTKAEDFFVEWKWFLFERRISGFPEVCTFSENFQQDLCNFSTNCFLNRKLVFFF